MAVLALSLRSVSVPGRLSSVDWQVAEGSAIALIGANGAGKSSLLHVLSGRLRPTEGEASLLGVPARDPRAASLRSYVPQRTELPQHLRAREFLMATAQAFGASTGAIDATVDRMGIDHVMDVQLGTLSGGMQQRVALAGGLLGAPPIWLLDEPAAALDAEGLRRLGAWCRDHVNEGGTVITSAHRPEEVETFADSACLMHEGKIISERPVADLFELVHIGGEAVPEIADPTKLRRVPGAELRSVLDGTWTQGRDAS